MEAAVNHKPCKSVTNTNIIFKKVVLRNVNGCQPVWLGCVLRYVVKRGKDVIYLAGI